MIDHRFLFLIFCCDAFYILSNHNFWCGFFHVAHHAWPTYVVGSPTPHISWSTTFAALNDAPEKPKATSEWFSNSFEGLIIAVTLKIRALPSGSTANSWGRFHRSNDCLDDRFWNVAALQFKPKLWFQHARRSISFKPTTCMSLMASASL